MDRASSLTVLCALASLTRLSCRPNALGAAVAPDRPAFSKALAMARTDWRCDFLDVAVELVPIKTLCMAIEEPSTDEMDS